MWLELLKREMPVTNDLCKLRVWLNRSVKGTLQLQAAV